MLIWLVKLIPYGISYIFVQLSMHPLYIYMHMCILHVCVNKSTVYHREENVELHCITSKVAV